VSFVYDSYVQGIEKGFATAPSAWTSINLALVTGGYVPDQAADKTFAAAIGSNFANNGLVAPVMTPTFAGNGINLAITAANKWLAVAAGPAVNAVVMYGVFGGTTQLICYFDDWGGLPFTPNGTDVTLNSMPTALGTGENTFRIGTPT
jgi:hypothetical protein